MSFFSSDFVVSPSGSLDHTIEEDCFSVSSRGSDKTGQEKVSQSDNSSIAEDRHARSLPNVVELENCDHIKVISLSLIQMLKQWRKIFSKHSTSAINTENIWWLPRVGR